MVRWMRTLLCIGLAAAAATAALAQDAAEQTQKAIEEGRFEEAVALLQAHWDEIPGTPAQKHLLEAGLLNRLGRNAEALDSAEKSLQGAEEPGADISDEELKTLKADAHLERGVAHYWLKNYEQAVKDLNAAIDGETSRPGEARAVLGATLAALQKYEEAQKQFEQATQELEPESLLYESARQWRDHLGQILATPETAPYGVRFHAGAGHSTNALKFNTDAQLPGGVSDQSTFFYNGEVYAWWDAYNDEGTRLRLSANPKIRWYESARSFSKINNNLTATLTHQVDEDLTLGGSFRWAQSWLMNPGRKLSRTFEPSLFGEYQWSEMTSTRFSISNPWTKYYLSGLSGPSNPDGTAVRTRVEQIVYLDDERRYAVIPAVGYTWNFAQGSDWDYGALDASVAVVGRPINELTLTAGVYTSWYDYRNDNSLASTPKPRQDGVIVPFFSATYEVNDWFGVTGNFSHTKNNSNLSGFRYSDTEWSVMPYIDIGNLLSSAFGGDEP